MRLTLSRLERRWKKRLKYNLFVLKLSEIWGSLAQLVVMINCSFLKREKGRWLRSRTFPAVINGAAMSNKVVPGKATLWVNKRWNPSRRFRFASRSALSCGFHSFKITKFDFWSVPARVFRARLKTERNGIFKSCVLLAEFTQGWWCLELKNNVFLIPFWFTLMIYMTLSVIESMAFILRGTASKAASWWPNSCK